VVIVFGLLPADAAAQESFDRTRDRGTGIALSMFGTYIEPGELIVYPFFEYYHDDDAEYAPNELGYGLDQDFRAPSRGREWLIFLGYGLSDRLAVEFEAALHMSERLEKSPDDPTDRPEVIEESGLGDVEGQIRWRWRPETESRPEIFSYFETVFPLQKDRILIGTSAWEFKLGTGIARAFRWGSLTARVAVEYDGEDGSVAPGEYAIDYIRQISPSLRVYAGIEGSDDEVEFIPELQWQLRDWATLKLNSAVGVTSKAADWAPEIGLMFRIP
jgi:hypothetical protein